MTREHEDPADQRYRDALQWQNRWRALIFALGSATTLFLIVAIFLYLRESWISGAVATLGTILTAGAVPWLLARKNDADLEEKAAFEDRAKAHRDKDEQDMRQQPRAVLLGRKNSPNERNKT